MKKHRTIADRVHRTVLTLLILAYLIGYVASYLAGGIHPAVPNPFVGG